MNTLAWLLILGAALLLRGVAKGRVVELPGDIRDLLLGAMTGDVEAVKEVAGRTGDGLTAGTVTAAGEVEGAQSVTASGTAGGGGVALLREVRRLGTGKPYIWGATFANGQGGDCSGLVWRAVRNLGIYSGPRFTTSTFPLQSRSFAVPVSTPQPGDIAVWQKGGVSGHMGVVSGNGTFFSALSRRSGVKDAPIRAISGRLTYYRLIKK